MARDLSIPFQTTATKRKSKIGGCIVTPGSIERIVFGLLGIATGIYLLIRRDYYNEGTKRLFSQFYRLKVSDRVAKFFTWLAAIVFILIGISFLLAGN